MQLTGDLSGKKIGLVKEGFEICTEDIVTIVKEGANKMKKVGAVVEDVSIPMHADGRYTKTSSTISNKPQYR